MSTLGDVLLVAGAVWMLIAAVGVLRFEDVFARMHAGTKATTLGLLLMLTGAGVQLPLGPALKLLLVGVLLFVTAPVGAHLIGRSVHRAKGDAVMHIDERDELAERDAADAAADAEIETDDDRVERGEW